MKFPSLFVKKSHKAGLPPGSVVYTGKQKMEHAHTSVIDYNVKSIEEREVLAEKAGSYLKKKSTTWVNIDGLHDTSVIEEIGEQFKLHPLVMEDIVSTDQRPKLEEFDGQLYIVIRMLDWDGGLVSEQLSLILGKGYVISFQERPGDIFDKVRERIRSGKGRIRRMGADYLAYALLDGVIDHYFVILEKFGEELEALEEELVTQPSEETVAKIHRLKREALSLRRSVWPLREVISTLQRSEHQMISEDLGPFLRDAYDHTIHVIDTVETYRDMLGGMLDLYLSSVSNKMNEVMKVLTIIATIFIPLTFIAGVYGMNFRNMPELYWHNGYFIVLGLMFVILLLQLWFFRRKGWL